MKLVRPALLILAFCVGGISSCVLPVTFASPVSQQTRGQGAASKSIGAIKAINGELLTLAPDSGADVFVTLQSSTRILRIAPGETSLKNATPIQVQDLQIGDRILVGGRPSPDYKSILASSIVVMKRNDVEARKQQELQDWQKRGLGGLVSAVDPSGGTVTISVAGFGRTEKVAVQTTKDTVIRRYAPDSVKFDDAKTGSLAEIHPGDQLRARGNLNADGTELTADEIVSGNFPYVEGTISSIDANASTISVQDVLSKRMVVLKVTPDSQLRQLPPEMAQRIATRLKEAAGTAGSSGAGGTGASASGPPGHAETSGGGPGGNGTASGRRGGADLQQMLNRLPPATLADLHKGDAVVIVATQGTDSERRAVINLYSGVEAILQAAPNASQAVLLSPWSLGGPPSGDANQ